MFLLNFGARSPNAIFEKVSSSTRGRTGACLLASGFDSGQLVRNELPKASVFLLDPQLYLAGLPASKDDTRVWRLASHSWFGVDEVVAFDSGEQRKRAWEGDVKAAALEQWPSRPPHDVSRHAEAAIRCQVEIGCSMVILPSPLLAAREDEGAPAAEWIRAGVAAARRAKCDRPLLATIALDEGVLNDSAFDPLGYLDALVTQISACQGIHGVYIVVAQAGESRHPFKTNEIVYRAYASLCRRFRSTRRVQHVLPNFCDIGGFLCMAHGADGFANGNFQSTRRLTLSAGADGRPYPYYYAHASASELRPEDDLDVLVGAGLLSKIAERTPFSDALISALEETGTAAGQQPWMTTINNVAAAHSHQVHRFCEVVYELLGSQTPRYNAVERWVSTAKELQAELARSLDAEKTRYVAPADSLLDALRSA
jgi:hypothetical protein